MILKRVTVCKLAGQAAWMPIEEGVPSIKKKDPRVTSSLGYRILSNDLIQESFSIWDVVEFFLEARGSYLVIRDLWLRPNSKSSQAGPRSGYPTFSRNYDKYTYSKRLISLDSGPGRGVKDGALTQLKELNSNLD